MGVNKKEYAVHELAELSGLSVRALHHYDEIGLLRPDRRGNNYRVYGAKEVDRLQHILLYRECGMGLGAIKDLLDNPSFDTVSALKDHLAVLQAQKNKLNDLIASVENTLAAKEEEAEMSDTQKFEAFKKKLVQKNEEEYGAEIREKYGDEEVDASNAKMMGLSEQQYQRMQEMSAEIMELLAKAMQSGGPAGEEAQQACDLHRQWLGFTWKEGMYSKQAHLGLGEMYVADERFKEYYDKETPGTAEFLRDALRVYCAE